MADMIIQCKVGKYEIPYAVIEAYSALYPTADQEFAQMTIWLESNASRRPASPKSAPRFVANWFKRVPRRAVSAKQKTADLLFGSPVAQHFVIEAEGTKWLTQ